jgi:hypothetical protein
MTYQQIIEAILEEHPGAIETEVKVEINKFYREFCRRTNILSDNSDIAIENNTVAYELPDDVDRVYRIDFKNSNGLLVSETDRLKFSIDRGTIKFYDYFWKEITAIPNGIATITLYYFKRPTVLSADTDVPEIDVEFQSAIVDRVSAKYFRKEKDFNTYTVLIREWERALLEGKKAANEGNDATMWDIKQNEY